MLNTENGHIQTENGHKQTENGHIQTENGQKQTENGKQWKNGDMYATITSMRYLLMWLANRSQA